MWQARLVPFGAMAASVTRLIGTAVDIVKRDPAKIMRFVAVALVTVPIGTVLLWLFLRADLRPVVANLFAVTLSTIPNYLLNRYWVWNKSGPNSVAREIAPFWAMAFLGLALSTFVIWIASKFTDIELVFLAAQFCSFGVLWVFKFFILERFLFGSAPEDAAEPALP